MSIKVLVILLLISSSICAQDAGTDISQLRETIRAARHPSVSIEGREKAANYALGVLKSRLFKEFEVSSKEDLFKKISENPDLLNGFRGDGGKFKGVLTDFSRLIAQISSEKILHNCDPHKTYRESMIQGLSSYDPCAQSGYSWSGVAYKFPSSSKYPGERIEVLPSFLNGENLKDLLDITQKLGGADSQEKGLPFVEDLSNIKEKNPGIKAKEEQFIYKEMELLESVYERSVFNAIRNVVSLGIRYSNEKVTASEVLQRVQAKVESLCQFCNLKNKSLMISRLTALLEKEQESGALVSQSLSKTTDSLCRKIEDAKYQFPIDEGLTRSDIAPSLFTATKKQAISDTKLKKQKAARLTALTKVAQGGDEGLLILTDAVTKLRNDSPEYLKLTCGHVSDIKKNQARLEDEKIVKAASVEAGDKAAEYVLELNRNLSLGLTSKKDDIDRNLKFMLKTNPRAFGEALSMEPALTGLGCHVLSEIKYDDGVADLEEKAWIWGTAVVGTGLTLTGVFAPVGAGLTMSAVAAGTAVGAIGAVKEFESAVDAKASGELFNQATFASWDENLNGYSQEEFKKYHDAKVSAMVNLGMSAVDVGAFMLPLMKSGLKLGDAADLLALETFASRKYVEPTIPKSNGVEVIKSASGELKIESLKGKPGKVMVKIPDADLNKELSGAQKVLIKVYDNVYAEAFLLTNGIGDTKIGKIANRLNKQGTISIYCPGCNQEHMTKAYFSPSGEILDMDLNVIAEGPYINFSSSVLGDKISSTDIHEVSHFKTQRLINNNEASPLSIQYKKTVSEPVQGISVVRGYDTFMQADEVQAHTYGLLENFGGYSGKEVKRIFESKKTVQVKDIFNRDKWGREMGFFDNQKNPKFEFFVGREMYYEDLESDFDRIMSLNQSAKSFNEKALIEIESKDPPTFYCECLANGCRFFISNEKAGYGVSFVPNKEIYERYFLKNIDENKRMELFMTPADDISQGELRKAALSQLHESNKLLEDQMHAIQIAEEKISSLKLNQEKPITYQEYLKIKDAIIKVKTSVKLK